MVLQAFRSLVLVILFAAFSLFSGGQKAHTLQYAPGKSITLTLPATLDIDVAATGLRRVRFFAKAPDGRIFATGMYNLADNRRGSVFILEGWDEQTHRFAHVAHYLDHLRNPNNIAFWTDPATQQSWLYLPLTDKLVRYKYGAGDDAPSSPPETLIKFPDYGLHYKYGGWHLTRTVAVVNLHGAPRIFVSVGSSCNYCQEDEVLRASVVSMDPDGKHQKIEAQGLRNAVDLKQILDVDDHGIFATNMGDDHLGDKLPEDTFFELATDAVSCAELRLADVLLRQRKAGARYNLASDAAGCPRKRSHSTETEWTQSTAGRRGLRPQALTLPQAEVANANPTRMPISAKLPKL